MSLRKHTFKLSKSFVNKAKKTSYFVMFPTSPKVTYGWTDSCCLGMTINAISLIESINLSLLLVSVEVFKTLQ